MNVLTVSAPQPAKQATLEHLDGLTRLLDSAFTIPGTRWTIGLDAIAGIVPVLGTLTTTGLSAYIVAQAWRHGAPLSLLVRMGANIGVDAAIGSVPVAGFVFDIFFKANRRNLFLLRRHLEGAST